MVLSDERATPEEGIGRRRIYDFGRMLEVAKIYVDDSTAEDLVCPWGVDPHSEPARV